LHDLTRDNPTARENFRWETINAIVYKIGGVIFVIGSILFFPSMSAYADTGAWVFFWGSILYLIVTGHDLIEVLRHAKRREGPPGFWDRLEAAAAVSYVTGTILFTVGSILFLSTVGLFTAAAWCFISGSVLFVVGATVNVLQVVQAEDKITLQLMNLTALTFVVGSVLFAVASIPYLWDVQTPADQELIDGFLAWQYLVGSILFLLGGIFNYWHAWVFIKRRI
jgi:hypothetical protein